MVHLRTVDAALREQVLALEPFPGQARFSGVASETLPAAERHRTRQPVAILRDDEPVGFFALDPADAICGYVAAPSVALRAFFVDAHLQGQGIATAALRVLPLFVGREHPDARAVVLTVNVSNPVARRLYERAGFRGEGRMHLGGAAGPQDVLVLPLQPPAGC
jgi:RimJ/RimL family protein N-acetyltransferase